MHRDIAAFGITLVLAEREDRDAFRQNDDWYRLLGNAVKLGVDDPCDVSAIVTFNYDRSVECYLHTIAQNCYQGVVRDRALAKLEELPIIHVHGSIGAYPRVPYGKLKNIGAMRELSSGIRMIHDSGGDSRFAQAKQLVANANQVIILGWAYDERSMQKLGLPEFRPGEGKRIAGTAYKLPVERLNAVFDMFGKQIWLPEVTAYHLLKDWNKSQ